MYHYTLVVAPFIALLAKDKFLWTTTAKEAFEKLKQVMSTLPLLAFPNYSTHFIIYIDASRIVIRAILLQENHLISFSTKNYLL